MPFIIPNLAPACTIAAAGKFSYNRERNFSGVAAIKEAVAVKVNLTVEAKIDGEQERFHFAEEGRLVTLNDHQHYLTYTEHQDGVATPVRIRLDEGQVSVTRDGARRTRLLFDPQAPTISHYRTEYGLLHLTVKTERLLSLHDLAAGKGHLVIKYQLHNGGGQIGDYQLDLRFER